MNSKCLGRTQFASFWSILIYVNHFLVVMMLYNTHHSSTRWRNKYLQKPLSAAAVCGISHEITTQSCVIVKLATVRKVLNVCIRIDALSSADDYGGNSRTSRNLNWEETFHPNRPHHPIIHLFYPLPTLPALATPVSILQHNLMSLQTSCFINHSCSFTMRT